MYTKSDLKMAVLTSFWINQKKESYFKGEDIRKKERNLFKGWEYHRENDIKTKQKEKKLYPERERKKEKKKKTI